MLDDFASCAGLKVLEGGKVLLAVSGGADSLCMAELFARSGAAPFGVAHCNFHLRGEESDADEEFVRNWAESHGSLFHSVSFDTESYASERKLSVEMAARQLRYEWFAELCDEYGYAATAVAHNANDNAETLILNLLRGTGTRGLRGMAQVGTIPVQGSTVKLIRPMLQFSRSQIEEQMLSWGLTWREDRTNHDTLYKRNKIRNEVFPVFAGINPSFIDTIGADIRHFTEVDDIAQEYFETVKGTVCDGSSISVPALLSLKHWRYVLFRLLEQYGFDSSCCEKLVNALEDRTGTFSGKIFESPTHRLVTTRGSLVLSRKEETEQDMLLEITQPGTYTSGCRTIVVRTLPAKDITSLKQPEGGLICDAAALPFPFTLRRWRNGDWMKPFGMKGRSKKLSDLFTDSHFSLPDKENAVIAVSSVLEGEGRVAAVLGLRMDEALRVTERTELVTTITSQI